MNGFEAKKKNCKYCFGTGVQTNKQTGIRGPCPSCGGTGKKKEKKFSIPSTGPWK